MISIKALRKKIPWRDVSPSIFLVLNTFVWYIFTYEVFYTILNALHLPEIEELGLFIAYYLGVAVTAVLGPKFLSYRRTRSLDLWPFIGTIATLLLATISSNGIFTNAFFALFLGASIGIGLPSCLSLFADSTSVENRGFVGGIIWSFVGFTVLIFAFLLNIVGQWEAIIALTIWRLSGGIGYLILNRKHQKPGAQKSPGYFEIIRKRSTLLYLFPWLMFSLINFAEVPILQRVFGSEFIFVQIVEYAIIGIIAVIGGVIADIVGRKRIVIAGFVAIGIEYAALSAFSNSPNIVYLFLALDGATWGLLYSVFFMAIWGDLGENYEKEKYYALGGLPFLLAGFLPILIEPYASAIPTTAAFSVASFFLFVAVLPLMYAPETLPEKTMQDRDLKSYAEKALKQASKQSKKKENKKDEDDKENGEESKEEDQQSSEYEEARKLAEKYY